MKWLKILWTFIIKHLPRFLRWSADHVEDFTGDCEICAENGDYPCDDCPYKEGE